MATVLVVEDERPVQAVANLILKNAGHDIVCASNVSEALRVILSGQHFDLLFTDMKLLEDEAGVLHVSHAASRVRPGLPVIYTSAGRLTEAMVRAFVSPRTFLPKPYTMRQLLTAVARLTGPVANHNCF
jgi:DNA-binding NtrC family response regulator